MILLDTHVLVWWLTDQRKLSSKAFTKINEEYKGGDILYSSISIWEICILTKKGKLMMSQNIDIWIKNLNLLPNVRSLPITSEIAQKSVFLVEFKNPDPADRLIVATALDLGCPVITKDKKIRNYKFVESIW